MKRCQHVWLFVLIALTCGNFDGRVDARDACFTVRTGLCTLNRAEFPDNMAWKLVMPFVCRNHSTRTFSSSPLLLCLSQRISVYESAKLNAFTGSKDNVKNTEFRVCYRFPYIRLARFLSRLKIYQTAATVMTIPPVFYCYSAGLVGIESCAGAVCICSLAMTLLYVAGNFFRRLVGLVALSNDERTVRISRLTFWGNRHDIYVAPDEIVPLGEYEDNFSDAYAKLRFYSTPDVLYMFLRYGAIVDRSIFAKVFGSY